MVRIYPAAIGEPLSGDVVLLCDGRPIPLHVARVSAYPINRRWPGHQRPIGQTELASFANFSADGPFSLHLRSLRTFREVVVRPLSRHVVQRTQGNTVDLDFPGPGNYTVEIDGPHHALHLFVDAPKTFHVDKDDPNVLYFGPGIHDAGHIVLRSNQTLCVEEGAVVNVKTIRATDAKNIRIVGHGILDNSCNIERPVENPDPVLFEEQRRKKFAITNVKRDHFIQFHYCDDVRIEGVTLRHSLLYNVRPICCRNLHIEGVKIIGCWRYNSDGIDMHNCEHVVIRDCFLRTYDDSICVKGFDYTQREEDMLHHGELYDTFRDVLVERCVIWNDWGNALEFGAETRVREIAQVTFRDCDVIHSCHNVCDILSVDYAEIHDVLYDDIRIEYSVQQRPVLQDEDAQGFADDPGCDYLPTAMRVVIMHIDEYSKPECELSRVRDVTFRNIAVTAPKMPPSWLAGGDAEHRIEGVRIENLTLNGTPVKTLEAGNVSCNEHVGRIEFASV